jgi:hypothetical protein
VIICSIFLQISKTKVIDKFFNHPLNLINDLNWLINYCNVISYFFLQISKTKVMDRLMKVFGQDDKASYLVFFFL